MAGKNTVTININMSIDLLLETGLFIQNQII